MKKKKDLGTNVRDLIEFLVSRDIAYNMYGKGIDDMRIVAFMNESRKKQMSDPHAPKNKKK